MILGIYILIQTHLSNAKEWSFSDISCAKEVQSYIAQGPRVVRWQKKSPHEIQGETIDRLKWLSVFTVPAQEGIVAQTKVQWQLPTLKTTATFLLPECSPQIEVQKMIDTTQTSGFTDRDLELWTQCAQSEKIRVITLISSAMPLSVLDVAKLKHKTADKKIELLVLSDDHRRSIDKTVNQSFYISQLTARLHYPVFIKYQCKEKRFDFPIYGAMESKGMDSWLD